MPEVHPNFAREWIEFIDPANPAELFKCDLTWLTSNWECIFGRGCKGVEKSNPNDGCCVHGAHFTEAADKKRVAKWVKKLTPDIWEKQEHANSKKGWTEKEDGIEKTRVVDGACIFMNSPEFAGGQGCALHKLAMVKGAKPLEAKPDVCWQVPVRLEEHVEEDGHILSVLREWKRRDWGEGGADFHWWCTESSDAFRIDESLGIFELIH